MLVAVPLMALLATALAAPVNVSLSSSVVNVVNTTDQYRACWVDSDCVSYPFCRKRPENCKCMTNGSCLLIRGYGQHCTSHQNCGDAMHCVTPTPQPLGGSRLKSVCKCVPHAKFSRYMNQCLRVNPPVLGGEMPRFADLPNPGEEDAGVPEEIPATYGGALLVGSLSSGLVLGCLILSLWCHYTTNQQRKKLLASQRSLYSSKEQPPSDETGGEKIPLDTYLPPPEMYQTPGFHNYLAISDCVSTSHIHEQLGTLGSELNRTLSLSCGEEYTNNKPPKKSNSNNSSVNV